MGAAWLGSQMSRCRQEDEAVERLSATQDGRSITVLFANPFAPAPTFVTGEPGLPEALFRGGPKWLANLLRADIFRARVSFGCAPPGNTFTWDADESGHRLYIYDFNTGLRDADMVWLNKLRYLRLLRLEANGISDAGLMQLDRLPYVEHLSLSNTAITDKGLVALANFPRLKTLELRGTNLSDAAVGPLGDCRRLEKLDLEMTNVTSHGVQSLQQKLPTCKIER